ncbi:MAG: carboxypeptidase-like regulatory domain-containing protein [Solirubrobacterales bacterium]
MSGPIKSSTEASLRIRPTLLIFLSLLLLGGSAVLSSPRADAVDRTVVIPAKIDWRIHKITNGCTLVGLVAWPEQKGATRWTLDYTRDGNRIIDPVDGRPFDDAKYADYGWSPGAGMHWASMYVSSHGGAISPTECEDELAELAPRYTNVKVRVTLKPEAKIAGMVKARDGSPLSGIRVRAGGRADRTDAKGRYSIAMPERERTYRVRASGPGFAFRPKDRRITVRPGRTARANFKAEGYVIEVRVTRSCPDATTSDDGNPAQCRPWVKGAKASAQKAGGGKVVSVFTRHDGTAVMMVDEAGKYRFLISYEGKKWRRTASVTSRTVTVERNISRSGSGLYVR